MIFLSPKFTLFPLILRLGENTILGVKEVIWYFMVDLNDSYFWHNGLIGVNKKLLRVSFRSKNKHKKGYCGDAFLGLAYYTYKSVLAWSIYNYWWRLSSGGSTKFAILKTLVKNIQREEQEWASISNTRLTLLTSICSITYLFSWDVANYR